MSPRRVLAEHSSRDLSDWLAYDRAFGIDTAHDRDLRVGVLASAVWNASGGIPQEGQKQGRPAVPGDFFPSLADDDAEPERTSHDAADVMELEDVEDAPLSEVERQTEALKSFFAAWGLKHNAAVRKAREQGLPENPDAN